MAKTKQKEQNQPLDSTEETLKSLEQSLTKTELYIEENKNSLSLIVGAIIVIFAAYYAYKEYYVKPKGVEAQNALLSEKKSTDITVTSANIAPILTLQIMQNDDPVAAIEQDGGIVTVRAQIVDINAADKHSLSWQKIDVQDLDRDDNALTIEFNPEDMPIGVYSFIAKVEELNTDKRLSAQVSINFVVVEAGMLSEAQDSDGDGRTDLEEGFGDIDLDNIPDYLDNDADTSRVPISSDSSITMLSTGSLKLGQYIIASKAEQSRYASFTPENLMEIVSEHLEMEEVSVAISVTL
mgnify:CR=1 FL=1